MKSYFYAMVSAAALASASMAGATATLAGSLAFVPATVIDFEQAAEGVSITNFYAASGVTFSTAFQTYGYSFTPNLSGGSAINFPVAGNPAGAVDFTIDFATVHANAGLAVVTDNPATFATYLNGVFVESIVFPGGTNGNVNVVSFTNSAFNSIHFIGTGDHGVDFDNLAFDVGTSAVPEPATWAMMIGGFALAGSVLRRRQASVRFA